MVMRVTEFKTQEKHWEEKRGEFELCRLKVYNLRVVIT